ncbi:putative nitrogen fixation protein NifT [[Phormidium ambiguum] IAM M-71]|uniref:Putative nitrogen fixation protein NifT n=1 Tax=[Phormidium ambiguum] IAM M-71 TaxID=454136 RepID=A0A1U7IPC5_9CYAN|nr:putative nitrogen fixation protein NifT [Phormidium ambiguum]OKH39122.1 putative nitrogen fixation protein NifT [Phormidium ambiguum IAM M-71]
MKVMLSRNSNGTLLVYVAKKDLEEEVVSESETDAGRVFKLANGWELVAPNFTDSTQLPQTIEMKRIT